MNFPQTIGKEIRKFKYHYFFIITYFILSKIESDVRKNSRGDF